MVPNAQGTLITRDAHEALAVLKRLVDTAEQKIRVAEREAVAVAIGHRMGDDPLRTLRDISEAMRSQDFEVAVSTVREKMQTAVEWHQRFQN
jgi:polysaccharide deacetylase 2 family uncharacterized protein YibQ